MNESIVSLLTSCSPCALVMLAIYAVMTFAMMRANWRQAPDPYFLALELSVTSIIIALVWLLGSWYLWLAALAVIVPVVLWTSSSWASEAERAVLVKHPFLVLGLWVLFHTVLMGLFQFLR